MLDQDIYVKIGQLLYNEAPDIDKQINALIYKKEDMIDIVLWCGDKLSAESAFRLSKEGSHSLRELTFSLYDYFVKNNMGHWNVLHFSVKPKTGEFNCDFECNEGLDNEKIAFWEYSKKFA